MHLARKVEDRELPLLLAARSTVGSTEGLQVLQGGVKNGQALQVDPRSGLFSSFDEALINCMPVGHTFTILDQSVPGTIHTACIKARSPR